MEYLGLRLRKFVFCFLRPRIWRLALSGIAPSVEHLPVLRGVQFGTVLDAGANRGQFAIAARYLWPKTEILCFEPVPAALEMLRKVADSIGATVYDFGLGAFQCEASMYVANHNDASSFLPIGQKQERLHGTALNHVERNVRVQPLSEVFTPDDHVGPILLKIDVQGTELALLEGASTILNKIDAVYVECSFQELYVGQALADEVVAFMSKAGFALAGVFNQATDTNGLAEQADFLFVNKMCCHKMSNSA